MVATPIGPALALFHPDGTVVLGVPATQAGPQGTNFVSAEAGTWEPVDDRTIHFTAVQLLSDESGTFTGAVTVDAYHTISEDGQTLISDPDRSVVTIRDSQNNIIDAIPGGPPAIGTRMGSVHPASPRQPRRAPAQPHSGLTGRPATRPCRRPRHSKACAFRLLPRTGTLPSGAADRAAVQSPAAR